MTFLSIIVPVYNVENYLEECLDSILAQTFTDYELILVDDGSTDQSGVICENYRNKSDVIKVIHKKNGGLVSARKTGVSIAKGEYIGYVDADDKIAPQMYEKLCKEATRNKADVVICDVWQWDGNNIFPIKQKLNGGVFSKKELEQEVYPYMMYAGEYYQFGFLPAMWNKIYRSDILKKNQILVDDRIRIGEDAVCSYLCILEAGKISYLKNSYEYYYRLNRKSMCRNWTNENIPSAAILLDYLYQRLNEYQNENIMEQYWYYYSYMFTNMLYEYGEAVRTKQIQYDAEKDFKELMDSKSFHDFKINYKRIRIPFYRRAVAYGIISGEKNNNFIWKLFVVLRTFAIKMKLR